MRRVGRWVQAGLWLALAVMWMATLAGHVDPFSGSGAHATLILATAGAALGACAMAGEKATAARLRREGRFADATIVRVRERYVSIPSGYNGWVTTVEVRFPDASGRTVNASYTAHERAAGKREGQQIQIVYDPRRPAEISPRGEDPRAAGVVLLGIVTAIFLGSAIYCAFRVFG